MRKIINQSQNLRGVKLKPEHEFVTFKNMTKKRIENFVTELTVKSFFDECFLLSRKIYFQITCTQSLQQHNI